MKIVLVTGISGTANAQFSEEVVKLGEQAGEFDWLHIRFAQLMYEQDLERKNLSYKQWEEGILKRGATLPILRSVTFDKLVEQVEAFKEEEPVGKDRFVLISTHATFWYRKTLLPGLNLDRLSELNPDYYITIVDDVIDIWKRLVETEQSRWLELSPVDILEWREIETFLTEQMAYFSGQKLHPKPFYIISRRSTPKTLVRLLTSTDLKKWYRSYPITFVTKRPEVKKAADRLGEKLEETSIVFDPMGIMDWDRQDELKSDYTTWCKNKGFDKRPQAAWDDIANHLRHQTVSRDHRLIDQSDGIVVFYPELDYYTKNAQKYELTPLVPFSSGVLDEMQYATQKGKEILLVWTSEKDPGPFLSSIYTRKFNSVEDLLSFVNSL